MQRHFLASVAALLLLGLAAVWWARGAQTVEQDGTCPLYLMWRDDPTTTMTVSWLCDRKDAPAPAVFYRASDETAWQLGAGTSEPFPHTDWRLHRVELKGLRAGALHHFIVAGEGRVHNFRTLPATLERPVRFVQGGDVGKDFEVMDKVNRLAASRDPDFAVWGGDLAYCDGKPEKAGRWWRFFQSVHRHLRTPDGRLVPLVVTPGNHEVHQESGRADCYLALFPAKNGRSYSAFDAGDYLTLLLLDTGHLSDIAGEQTAWLETSLAGRRGRPHVLPVYHVGAYPSVRGFDNGNALAIRESWVPLFEEHGVGLAFEHNDHTYKVTHPLLRGAVDPSGVVYAGDGAWGVGTREVRKERPYLRKAAGVHHFHEVILDRRTRHLQSVSSDGSVLDSFRQDYPGI
jgi:hypothetical protein